MREIIKRMAPRRGENVYQVASFSTPILSASGMHTLLGSGTKRDECGVEWTLESFTTMQETLSPLLSKFSDQPIYGFSKPLKTKSEKRVRVIATLIPTVELYVQEDKMEMDTFHINMMYVLIDQDGEIHPPKDSERREMKIESSLLVELKQQAASDLKLMAARGLPLSPAFYRQIGMEEAATLAEQEDAAVELAAQKIAQERVVKRATKQRFEVEEILEERAATGKARTWYRVRWQGYHPSWEAWRIEGSPGDPLVTWEPEAHVIGTEAMRRWYGWPSGAK